jgi:fructose-1,6-bisphosphatase/inositol monophosphatase family enzyme
VTVDASDRRSDLDVAIAAAVAGAAVVRGMYREPLARYDKSATDFATQADIDSEHAIRVVIHDARPGDGFVGEETGASLRSESGRRWLVDPLCGTLNFAAGTPLAAVNVALVDSTGVLAAASADPIAGELFWTDGEAAWVRSVDVDRPVAPSASSKLIDINCDGEGELIGPQLVADPQLRAQFGARVLSTTLTLAWVAAGRRAGYVSDGHLEGSVHFTAGIALCQAAGCIVTDLAGDPVYAASGLIAAADPATHRQLLELISKYR